MWCLMEAKSLSRKFLLPNPHQYNIFCQILIDTISFAKSLSIQYPLPNPYQESILCQILINTIFFAKSIQYRSQPTLSLQADTSLPRAESCCRNCRVFATPHLTWVFSIIIMIIISPGYLHHHNYHHHLTWVSSSS